MDFKNRTILITGGTGSLGKHVLKRAQEEDWGCKFVIFSRDETKQSLLKSVYPQHKFVLGDITRQADLKRALWDVDTIFHFAAYKQVPSAQVNVSATIETNVIGSRNVAEVAIEFGIEHVVATSTDKACLDWHSRVELGDGSTEYIGNLVKNKYSGDVVSINPITGKKELKKVVNWYKNKLGDRKRYKISYESSYEHRGQLCGPVVTEDHLILTTNGWKRLDQIDIEKDLLVTSEFAPNDRQKALLVGMLLGDSSLQNKRRSFLVAGHAENQQEWLNTKVKALNGLEFNELKIYYREEKRQPFYRKDSVSNPYLGWLYTKFYPYGIKNLPRDLFEECFSKELLVTWYLDDGTLSKNNGNTTAPNARIASHSYKKEDVEWVVDFLNKKGFECYVYEVSYYNKVYYEIRFTVEGTKTLFNYIGEAVIPSMQYKVNDLNLYDNSFWNLGESDRFIDHPIIIEKKLPKRDVYCLDVEDNHSFVCNNVVVHNCQPVNAYGKSKALMEDLFQEANHWGITKFHLTRYGNVVCSNASVIPLFVRQKKAGGPLTVTDFNMTRFWISLDQAVNLVLRAIDSKPGVIVVPKAPAMTVYDIAKNIAGGLAVQETGIRPGEKIHELMVHKSESIHTDYDDDYFYIYPPTDTLDFETDEFEYSSNNPLYWLTWEQMLPIIEGAGFDVNG